MPRPPPWAGAGARGPRQLSTAPTCLQGCELRRECCRNHLVNLEVVRRRRYNRRAARALLFSSSAENVEAAYGQPRLHLHQGGSASSWRSMVEGGGGDRRIYGGTLSHGPRIGPGRWLLYTVERRKGARCATSSSAWVERAAQVLAARGGKSAAQGGKREVVRAARVLGQSVYEKAEPGPPQASASLSSCAWAGQP